MRESRCGNLETVENRVDEISGLNPSNPIICDGFVSEENHAHRAEKYLTFIAAPAFSSPAKKTLGPRSDMSGMHSHAFMTPIRDGFTADHCLDPLVFRPFPFKVHKSVIRVLPFGSRFSVLAFPKNSLLPPSSPRFLDCVKSLSPTSVSLVPDEGWQVVARKEGKSPLLQFYNHSGRCFKCGLRGHLKSHCRFNGFCFHCKSPNHTVAVCRFFSQPRDTSVMAGKPPHHPITLFPTNESCD